MWGKIKDTEDVRILEIDFCVSDWIGRVKENFSFSVEFDGVGGFINSICGLYEGEVGDSLGLNSDVLLVHVLNVVDGVERSEGAAFQAHR